ncbi:retrotransposon ty1-copia subclass [Moniliophthora roreri MCA 2997]|uniref:Retrotransposon ty1-copia subclass n=1 Tax=Moniliophthora roreri (strain MCA 2997) TaxID=1381753 RepID=V2YHI3_MONRO|nr:retrotransposon ty1-copia subclass [Moniliophthora roreri MCA 2997]
MTNLAVLAVINELLSEAITSGLTFTDGEASIIHEELLYCELPECCQGFSFAAIPATMKTVDLRKPLNNYYEAHARPDSLKWKEAELEELVSLNRLGVFQETELPEGAHTVEVCWVYDYKLNEHGEIVKYKA